MASRLSELDREQIVVGLERGVSIRAIAARLGRAASTISREIERTAFEHLDGRYSPWWAQRRAEDQALRPRTPRLAREGPLRSAVIGRLNRRWSPREIAVWLRLEFPDQAEMHVSHETIYQAIYLQSRGNLRAELKHQKALRSGRTRRRSAVAAAAIRSNRDWVGLNISERPAGADDRAVPGHWEGDLLLGKNSQSAIATLVERSTRFLILVALPDGRVSDRVVEQLALAMGRLPHALRRSLAWDQGSEMARHPRFSMATSCPVYFCDPHSPWQRGSNENTNGLLRDYYPTSTTDFRTISQAELDEVAEELNTRIRQTLDWQTPAAKLAQILDVASVT
jgi:transposase, IS30 family